tara:strand:+ start:292 stop:453 length:162 start_codon:yes stop_codon:yes gene_type:complete
MTEDSAKVLTKIIEAQQKQLENSQQQISMMTKEFVKFSTLIEKLEANDNKSRK